MSPTGEKASDTQKSDSITRGNLMPGILCLTCAGQGYEVWVLPGRACGYCRTPARDEDDD
ncbi:hypothetical protein QBC35DRAFT_447422 [Podospora australis]|uniref:Uncharacterized protein n=1 Tax=Podospora australis TaxID=1536484 RepID=A0AAN6X2T2_9PEZI|nr:hypothetical protein QBC35DRAFT_447422 [Podospora australis]